MPRSASTGGSRPRFFPLFISQDRERPLSENVKRAEQADELREEHGKAESREQHDRMKAPGKIEYIGQYQPGERA